MNETKVIEMHNLYYICMILVNQSIQRPDSDNVLPFAILMVALSYNLTTTEHPLLILTSEEQLSQVYKNFFFYWYTVPKSSVAELLF